MRTKANVQAIKNVVLVHGAFADGSGWKGVYKIPTAKGHDVTIVQNPATSLEDDVKATKAALDKQDRPAVLVGHSWSGAVITEAGNHANVASLVYVAAFQPVNGESTLQLFQSAPPGRRKRRVDPKTFPSEQCDPFCRCEIDYHTTDAVHLRQPLCFQVFYSEIFFTQKNQQPIIIDLNQVLIQVTEINGPVAPVL
jgi:pimeloyl-ACP methyl ester carboxylesterase